MTIPRVLIAAALLVIGFMIWGLHKDVWLLQRSTEGHHADMVSRVAEVSSQVLGAHQKLDAASSKIDRLRPRGVIKIGKPRVRPVPHLPPQPALGAGPVNPFEQWFPLFRTPPPQS